MSAKINQDKILQAMRKSIPLTITTYKLPHETEIQLEEVLGIFLKEAGQQKIKDQIAYCLKELTTNAKKANTKRVYFNERNLDIKDPRQYQEGMDHFKNDTLAEIDYWLDKQQKAGLYIKVSFHLQNQGMRISIRNNVPMTQKEQMRVYDRIARSRAFSSIDEAFSAVMDESEGAGLGIVIIILMLRRIGLDDTAFDIDVEGEETIASIHIPFDKIKVDEMNKLTREIVSSIENLPQFPENIVKLQQQIADPDFNLDAIARNIAADPSLTADLLKMVNSAQYMVPKKVENIAEAVKLVGLRGVKNILYSIGSQKLLGHSEDQKELWQHANRTAFYAYTLARNFKRKRNILDDVFVGGMLHDMGKIVFTSVHPSLLEKIQGFAKERDAARQMVEDIMAGMNHAEIGALIAEKWKFPESLVHIIRYHHQPYSCKPEYRDEVYTVYLANILTEIERSNVDFEHIEPRVLQNFGITMEDQLNTILERLQQAYQKEKVF